MEDLNDLEHLENLACARGDATLPASQVSETETHQGQPEPSGYDVIADLLPHEELKALNKWTQTYQLRGDDPFYGGYIMTKTTFAAAIAAGKAATIIHDEVTSIPAMIQKAVIFGGEDVAGRVRAALVSNLGEFAQAIGQGVHLATAQAVVNVQTALKDFDKKVDKAIIGRRDAVVAQWVQSGSDALDQKVREAVKTERTINLVFMLFMILATLVLGIVLGIYLHF
jgi:hypothetical protein